MKVELSISKGGQTPLYQAIHDISDAQTFGRAFAEVWARLHERRMEETTSVGALMDVLNEDLIADLDGARIEMRKL